MKIENWKVWTACIVVFVVMSPQNAVASLLMAPTHMQIKFCMAKNQSMAYMKQMAKDYGRHRVKQLGWSKREWKALLTLWNRESRWDYKADNPHSTAYGIPQILDLPKNLSISEQVDAGLKYIQSRYKTPTSALAHHHRKGWY
jgi:hypothetical protein